MRVTGILLLAIAAFQTEALAQGVMQVSSVAPASSTLDCSQRSTATIAVQIWFAAIDGETQPQATVRLSVYSTDPPSNSLVIREPDKRIALQKSPATAEFQVACGSGTRPGAIRVAAAIVNRPRGVKIEDSPNAIATVNVDRRVKE